MTRIEEIKSVVKELNKQVKGAPTTKQLELYVSLVMIVWNECPEEKYYALQIGEYTKKWCLWYCNNSKNKEEVISCMDWYYEVLLVEAPHYLDSYMLYLEKDRPPKERFYQPRRKQFLRLGITQALQDMEDDKYDILTLSLSPGVGKALENSENVLTPKGYVQIKNIKVGDLVMGGDGKPCNVLGVFPQGIKPIYKITLLNGKSCKCSKDHLWTVVDKLNFKKTTITLEEIMKNKDLYKVPVLNDCLDTTFWMDIRSVDYTEDAECTCIYVDNREHLFVTNDYIVTHNTTLEKFFLTWVIGRHPDMFSLFYSHSGAITRLFYDGVQEITTNKEYNFAEIFPYVQLTRENAKSEQLTFNKYKPFPNLQTGTIESNMAGRVRCNAYLLCDDLIGKMEQALNKVYLDKLWKVKYTGDAKQRKMTGCKEIHIATRWSVHDVIGRLQNLMDGNKRCKFIACDCYDEKGESNFDFDYGVGLTTKFLREQELFMDDISFKCLYRNQPIEREGLLYHCDELRRYASLPNREPDAIMGICDTKEKGTDYMFLPVFYQYDSDYYLVDCICNNSSDYGFQYNEIVRIICKHHMQQLEFESNMGGSRIAFEIDKRIKEKKERCNITTKPTESNKETKIIVNADWVKQHVLFRDQDHYLPKDNYGTMVNLLCSYSVMAKSKQLDDVPDGLAMFALYVENKYRIKKATIIQSPF